MEAHGQICHWTEPDHLTAWCSTQAVSGVASQLAEGVGIPAANVRVIADFVGGGFGSKFGIDRWGIECAKLAKLAGAPVKLMLDRHAELTVAGDRPSAFAEIEVGAKKDGTLTAWISKSWGSGGPGSAGNPPLPYVFQIPNRKQQHIAVPTNKASSRAWRAPNHPQGCYLSMSALDDLAAALGMDPLDLVKHEPAAHRQAGEDLPRGAGGRRPAHGLAPALASARRFEGDGQARPGPLAPHLGGQGAPQQLRGDDPSGRHGGGQDLLAGHRHRHPHGDRDRPRRLARPAARRRPGADRRQPLSGVRRLRRQHDGGGRLGGHPAGGAQRARPGVRPRGAGAEGDARGAGGGRGDDPRQGRARRGR